MKLTEAHEREIKAAIRSSRGVVEPPSAIGGGNLRRANWLRMMDRLCAAGLFRPYVHGGYEITDEGRKALETITDK